jgi:anti-sigma factor RsiW
MKHPNEATLALHAGGDLGIMARWKVERHLAQCESCRRELAAFTNTRETITGLAEIPELPWARLEAEMKANIRLGLSAGECVRGTAGAPSWFSRNWWEAGSMNGVRAAVICAAMVILLAVGLFVQRPQPSVSQSAKDVVVENTANGIQISDGGQALGLTHTGAQSVIYSVSAQGNMGARYVDPKTGYVTINNLDLYAQ